eukprot:scaffold50527_cov56-Phaeocystis_antarctica.AAC.2
MRSVSFVEALCTNTPGGRLDHATRRSERAPGAAEPPSPSRWRCVIRRLERCEHRRGRAFRLNCSAHHGAAVPPIGAHHSLPDSCGAAAPERARGGQIGEAASSGGGLASTSSGDRHEVQ